MKGGNVGLAVAALVGFGIPNVQAQALGRLLACADVARAEERLQCYDAAARVAIGLAPSNVPAPTPSSAALDDRAQDLELREMRIRARELELSKLEKSVKLTSVAAAGVAAPAATEPSDTKDLARREAALAQREAALTAREAHAATAKPKGADDDGVSLFGIPIPFTKNDALNRTAELPNQTIVRDEDGIVESIESAVSEWSASAEGFVTVVLANGQVWRQIEGSTPQFSRDPAKRNVARISRAAIGSFSMMVNGSNRSVKVRRIDGVARKG